MYGPRGARAGCSLRNTNKGLKGSETSKQSLLFIQHIFIEPLPSAGTVAGTEDPNEEARPCPWKPIPSWERHKSNRQNQSSVEKVIKEVC